jgi:hypothetical protein
MEMEMKFTTKEWRLIQEALNVLHHFYRQQRDNPPPTVTDPTYAPKALKQIKNLSVKVQEVLDEIDPQLEPRD